MRKGEVRMQSRKKRWMWGFESMFDNGHVDELPRFIWITLAHSEALPVLGCILRSHLSKPGPRFSRESRRRLVDRLSKLSNR